MAMVKLADLLSEKYPLSKFIEESDEIWIGDPMHHYVYDEKYEEDGNYFKLTLMIGALPDEAYADKLDVLSDAQLKSGIVSLGRKFIKKYPLAQFDVRDDVEMAAKLFSIKISRI
jgi:hypothetical protein